MIAVLRAWASQLGNGALGLEKKSPEEAEPSSTEGRTGTPGRRDPTSVRLEMQTSGRHW